ncbi:MAG: ComEC/Rec2 family competence protein [Acidobacteriota bacterium]|nr:ComEC/Rec2 family competence protein [Acidobacteriota bacterium]
MVKTASKKEVQNSGDKKQDFSLFPLCWLASATACGILAANWLVVQLAVWLILLIFAAIFAVFQLNRGNLQIAAVSSLAAFLFLGAVLFESEKQSIAPNRLQKLYDEGEITAENLLEITGVLQNEPEMTIGGAFLTIKTEKINYKAAEKNVSGVIRAFVPLRTAEDSKDYEKLELRYGARISVIAALSREERFRNPGTTGFEQILQQKKLDAIAKLKSPQQIKRLGNATVFPPFAWLYNWRQSLIENFHSRFSRETAGVLIASLLNNRYFLSNETSEKFRIGGTFHILVISGLHITFIGIWVAWLVRKFTKRIVLQFVIANSLLWIYSLMVGAETPVTRAAFMFTVFHAAVLFGRRATSLNAFGAAALILLVSRPTNLFDQSFLLTFVSVAAIITFAFPLWEKMREIGGWQPSQSTPQPPACSRSLKILCETLFWNETKWQREQRRNLWKCRLFKFDLAKRIEKNGLQTIWRFIFGSILVSAIVQIWLAPLMIVCFHRFPLAGLILNLFVGILIAVESLAAIAALLVAQASESFAQPLILLCEAANWLMIRSVEPFSNFAFANFRIPIYSGWMRAVYFVYFAPLAALAIVLHRWNPFQIQNSKIKIQNLTLIAVNCSLLAVIVFHPFSSPFADNRLRVDFLDVGQGDAALITFPNGATMLVDGGGRPFIPQKIVNSDGEIEVFAPDSKSIGEAVISEFLWEKGYSKIDYLLPSHADTDHIDGLNDAAKNFAVEAALVARTPLKDPEFREFYENLQARRIPVEQIARGQILEIGGARIEILFPPMDANSEAVWENDDSVVLRLTYGAHSFLLTGDIEKGTERFLSQQPENLVCDVVKVPHHGSRTSSTENFVRATKAKFAIISVGRDSPYGHPHKEVVERWKNAGTEVLTTGERGTISFSTDGEDLRVETFVKN